MATETRLNPDGLIWLAERNSGAWLKSNGKPCLSRIARDAELNRTHLHNVLRGRYKPGTKFIDSLCDLAVTTGVSQARARAELFHRVEIAAPAAQDQA